MPHASTTGQSAFFRRWPLTAWTCLAVAALAACSPHDNTDKAAAATDTSAQNSPTRSPAIALPVAYAPLSADALYRMVAPIALYPDKLVALVLAGAIHPDEVTAATTWLSQNPSIAADAVNQQPWDPSIKSLSTFPNALNLMQSNLPWTTALGQAYNNDPLDVLNAVQVMRHRAQQAGSLQSNAHQRVGKTAVASIAYTPNTTATEVYSGPIVVAPPTDYITIEPVQAQTVYLPSYDPRTVYGEPVAYYEGYSYRAPPMVHTGTGVSPVAVGALTFGAGVVLAAALDHHDWGWNAWGVYWGDSPSQARWRPGDAPLPPQARPAVTYRQSTYISHVTNVVNNNRYVDNHHTEVRNAINYTGTGAPASNNIPAEMDLGKGPRQAGQATPHQGEHRGEAALAGAALVGAATLNHAAAAAPQPAAILPNKMPRPSTQRADEGRQQRPSTNANAPDPRPALQPSTHEPGRLTGLGGSGTGLRPGHLPDGLNAPLPTAPVSAMPLGHLSSADPAATHPVALPSIARGPQEPPTELNRAQARHADTGSVAPTHMPPQARMSTAEAVPVRPRPIEPPRPAESVPRQDARPRPLVATALPETAPRAMPQMKQHTAPPPPEHRAAAAAQRPAPHEGAGRHKEERER